MMRNVGRMTISRCVFTPGKDADREDDDEYDDEVQDTAANNGDGDDSHWSDESASAVKEV
jgi:hypothetical protein